MIVVLGRPSLDERGVLAGVAARIASAAAAAGASVEVVGSVSDDAAGDKAVTELGRAGVGHAALLRTPVDRALEAADIELGLSYLADCRVLVLAEPLGGEALRAALDGASFHQAQLIVVREPAADSPPDAAPDAAELPDAATVLVQPDEDAGAFVTLVARYATGLDQGVPVAQAWAAALAESGWETAAE